MYYVANDILSTCLCLVNEITETFAASLDIECLKTITIKNGVHIVEYIILNSKHCFTFLDSYSVATW